MEYDLKIINGTIFDGTGSWGYSANLAILNGKIVEIGVCHGSAQKTIDAKDAIVMPGFIDLHTHYDGQITWDEELRPSVNHGVTTAILGNCGVGFAPVHEADHDRLIRLMEGVEDIPGTALAEGLTWNWNHFPEYMNAIDALPHTINFGVQIPHDPVRVFVMGERALAQEKATEDDIAKMRNIVRAGLEAGAFGFTTGRSDVHRTADGEWTPASESSLEELVGIAKAFHRLNHGVLQAVSDFDMERGSDKFDSEFDIVEAFAQEGGENHPTSISVMQRDFEPGQWLKIIDRVEKANAKGIKIFMQVAPRAIGVMVGLQCTFHPFMGFPSYKKISHLSLEYRVKKMHDPKFKTQILKENSERLAVDGTSIPPIVDYFLQQIDTVSAKLFELGENPDYEQPIEKSILYKGKAAGKSPLESIYDAMLKQDGKALLYFPIYNYTEFNYDNILKMMNHPQSLSGLSDGGAHVGTICDGSFPTYLLSYWTRDRKTGDKIPLKKAIHALTKKNADYLGIRDRGELKTGMKADINIIDIARLKLFSPEMVQDLPAGGQRLLQKAEGYRATIVSGEFVIENDELTGHRPGRLIRMGK